MPEPSTSFSSGYSDVIRGTQKHHGFLVPRGGDRRSELDDVDPEVVSKK